jgi:hypothetical protein
MTSFASPITQTSELDLEHNDKIVIATPYSFEAEPQNRQHKLFYEDLTERLEDLSHEVFSTFRDVQEDFSSQQQDYTLISGISGSDLILIHPIISKDITRFIGILSSFPKPVISFYQKNHKLDLQVLSSLSTNCSIFREVQYKDWLIDGLDHIEAAVKDFYYPNSNIY